MKPGWSRVAAVAVGGLFLAAAAAFGLGKYRTATAAFDAAFLLFLLFLFFRRWPLKYVVPLLALAVVAGGTAAASKFFRKEDLFRWLVARKEQGRYLEIPALKRPADVPKKYLERLLENHLGETRKGIPLNEIAPKFSRLNWEWFEQLDWMGVKYVIVSAKEGNALPLEVEGIPVAGAFPEGIVFKVPKRERVVAALFGSGFSGDRRMRSAQETIYLFNHLDREIPCRLEARFAAPVAVSVELRHSGRGEILWTGEAGPSGTPVSLEKMTLSPGKNKLLLTLLDKKRKGDDWASLVAPQTRHALRVESWKAVYPGLTPAEAASEHGNSWQPEPEYEKWLEGLPDGAMVLEYPLAHKNWRTPVDYNAVSPAHARRNVNFKFDAIVASFAQNHLENVPGPKAVLWGKELGVAFIAVHRPLYASPPFLEPPLGLALEKKFGGTSVYRLDPRRVRFEAEKSPADAGTVAMDAEASGGHARLIEGKSKNERRVFAAHGPHVPVAAGRYRARFRLKAAELSGKPLASLDVCAAQGTNVLAAREIRGTDFKKPGEYQTFDLEFDLPEKASLELRVFYSGKKTPLWIDSVTLEAVSGAAST